MESGNNNLSNSSGRVVTGLIILGIGALLLLDRMGVNFPGWLLSWPMILVLMGLVIGIRHKFRNPVWIVLMGLGGFFLADNFFPDFNAMSFILPAIVIAVGLLIILRPSHTMGGSCGGRWHRRHGTTPESETAILSGPSAVSNDDGIEITAVFGGVKKRMMTRNFTGGEIVCFMGGAEVDLMQSDIVGRAEIDLTQVFGGTKLLIPAHWNVRSEMAAIFAGIEDKRPLTNVITDANKLLVLKGTSVFGGIEIKSY